MGKGFKKGSGGSNPLNFKVVGGTEAPSNPRENTIWVNTDQKITSWVFSAVEPTAPVEGMIWFYTGVSSSTEFNALKKNGIQVYPISAKQYVSGALVEKTAKTYQGGAWVSWWDYTFYNYGTEYLDATGSIVTTGKALDASSAGSAELTIQRNSNNIRFFNSSANIDNKCGIAYYARKINLTNFSTLTFNGSIAANGTGGFAAGVGIWSDIRGSYVSSNLVASIHGDRSGEATLDISNLSGEYYIGFWAYGNVNVYQYVTMKYLKLS